MRKTAITNPLTGEHLSALQTHSKDLIVETPNGTQRLEYKDEAYLVPEQLFFQGSMLTITECAKRLGTSRQYVHQLYKRGILHGTKSNGLIMITSESLSREMERRSANGEHTQLP